MCQLTLIDFKDQRIAKFITKPLTELNTLGVNAQTNNDGFGYVCFVNLDNIVKTEKSAQIWWNENKTSWKRNHRNVNGLYHVRACSTNQQKIGKQFAHPFIAQNLIQIHNGTLFEIHKNNKDISHLIKNYNIDSQNFLETLSHYVELSPPLKPEHINKAIKHWSGTMALMLIDKRNPSKVIIVKDDIKPLHICTFKINKESIGIIINTQIFELEYIADLVTNFIEATDKIKISWEIEELPSLEISEYKIGTFTHPQFIEKLIPHKEEKTIHEIVRNLGFSKKDNTISNTQNIVKTLTQLGLSYLELQIIAEVCFNKNFFVLEKSDIELLEKFLNHLNDRAQIQPKFVLWQNITKKHSKYDVYKSQKIFFPYFLNNKKSLKKQLYFTNQSKIYVEDVL